MPKTDVPNWPLPESRTPLSRLRPRAASPLTACEWGHSRPVTLPRRLKPGFAPSDTTIVSSLPSDQLRLYCAGHLAGVGLSWIAPRIDQRGLVFNCLRRRFHGSHLVGPSGFRLAGSLH